MKTTRFITAAVTAVILSTGAAMASTAAAPTAYANDPIVAQISDQLAQQGYVIISIEKTLLGRYQIEAVANGQRREIVVSTTGTVFRDEWHADTAATATGLDNDHDGILDDGATVDAGTNDGVNGFPSDDNGGTEGANDHDGGNDNGGMDDNGGNDNGGNDDNGGSHDGGSNDNGGTGNDDNGGNDNGGTGNDDNGGMGDNGGNDGNGELDD